MKAEFSERIKVLIENVGSASELARITGLSRRIIGEYSAGRSLPTIDKLQLLANAGKVSVQWLANGDSMAGDDPDFISIPRYDVSGSAGHDAIVDHENIVGYHHYRKDYLRDHCLEPDKCAVIDVAGDSMSPTLNKGDIVLIDVRADQRRHDGVYVIRLGEELLIKRVQFLPGGKVRIISDNKAYPDYEVDTRDPSTGFEFVGRVDTKSGPVL